MLSNTQIKVINNYKKEVNVKIQGAGVGGCDVIMQPGDENDSDCWCLWGTISEFLSCRICDIFELLICHII